MATETKTFYPQAHTDFSGYQISNAANPVGQGSNNTTKGASIYAAKIRTATCYWPFDVSAIPEKATIDSVSCVAAVKADTGAFSFSANVRLYSGSTAKGFAVSLANNNNIQKITVSDGIWTRAELGAIRLRTYFQNKGSFALALVFYGADLTVTYTYQSEKFMLKLGGAWHDVSRVFKKVNGIWVEQTDLANVIEDGVRYQNGGEIVDTTPLISFTIKSVSYQAKQGMTWREWVDSKYNTAGFYLKTVSGIGTLVYAADGTSGGVFYSGNWVGPDDIIQEVAYLLVQ